jgi:cellobiose phosphorylase
MFAYSGFNLSGLDSEFNHVAAENLSKVIPEMGGVFVKNMNTLVPTNRFNGYIISLNNYTGSSGYRSNFTRSDFGFGTPKILWGWNADNNGGFGPDCCGLVQVTVTIPPKGKIREDFLIGLTSCPEEVIKLRNELTSEKLDKMLKEQEAIQAEKAKAFQIDLGEENKNISGLMNIFIKNGLMRYIIEPVGFRDNLQNDNAGALIDVDLYSKNTLFQLSSQYADGAFPRATRPFHRLQYSDQPAWVLLTIPGLIEESGDLTLLDKEVAYLDSDEVGTVWDHMIRSMRFLTKDLGQNGLCDQRYADWNDGLTKSDASGERESVMVTFQLCYGLLQLIKLAKIIGDEATEKEAQDNYDLFKKRLNDIAWDGKWYTRTICEDGYQIGSDKNDEGKIWMNPQTWAVLSDVASPEQAETCMNAVEKHLNHEIGYIVLAPPFTKFSPKVGEISNGIPNFRENGGCYCHASTFKGIVDCMLKRPEKAWNTYVKLAPDNPGNPVSQSKQEPFSFTNNYSAVDESYGLAGYPWRTGTAGWMVVLLIEWILGARRNLEGLMINPCLTKTIPTAKLTRKFRGATYYIEYDNSAGRCVGTQSIICDGKEIEGNILPDFKKGDHIVKVII